MAKRVGLISINLEAGTAQFNTDLAAAKAKMRDFAASAKSSSDQIAHAQVTGVQAASGAIRVFEGNIQNNLRAVENFLSKTLGLGNVLKAAFPLVGGIAFAGLISEMTEKLYNFFRTLEEHTEKTAGAFRELNASLRTTNDSLTLSNDKLANEIAKLQGKPQNGLAVALDEARVAADRLGESLDADLAKLAKVVSENKPPWWQIWRSGVTDLQEREFGKSGVGGFRADVAGLGGDPSRTMQAYADEVTFLQKELERVQAAQKIESHPHFYDDRQDFLKEFIRQYQGEMERISQGSTNTRLQGQKDQLTAAKENSEAETRALKAGYDRMLAADEAFGEMMASEKLAFRENELVEISQYGNKYKTLRQELMVEIGALEQASFKEANTAREKDAKDQERYLEEMSRTAVEWTKRNYEAIKTATKDLQGGTGTEPRQDIPQAAIAGNLSTRLAGTPLGRILALQAAGHATIQLQEEEIANEQRILDEMEKGGFTREQELEQRRKILELQNALQKAVEGTAAADAYRQTQINELLRVGTLGAGWRAFWLEQQQQAEKPGQILFDGMNHALDGVSKNLAALATGSKSSFGKTFEEIGRQMTEHSISAALHNALGALGQKLGIGGGVRDGQSKSGAIFVDVVGPNGATTATTPSSPTQTPWPGPGTIFGGSTPSNPLIFNYAGAAYPRAAAAAPVRQDGTVGATGEKGGPTINVNSINVTVSADGESSEGKVKAAIKAAIQVAIGAAIGGGIERQQRIPQ